MADVHASSTALELRVSTFVSVIESCRATRGDGSALEVETALAETFELLATLRSRRGSLYLVGNGGSAAIASHAAIDFVNVGGLRAMTLHESSLMTCMANDYGYAAAFGRVLGTVAQPGDALIAVSSSGKSPNILNAASRMRELGGAVVTLSGFAADSPLRSLGDMNFWLDSTDYGMVEIGHQFLLHTLSDRMLPPAREGNV